MRTVQPMRIQEEIKFLCCPTHQIPESSFLSIYLCGRVIAKCKNHDDAFIRSDVALWCHSGTFIRNSRNNNKQGVISTSTQDHQKKFFFCITPPLVFVDQITLAASPQPTCFLLFLLLFLYKVAISHALVKDGVDRVWLVCKAIVTPASTKQQIASG